MTLMNELIKKYAKSDDLGEYSKKEELWKAISESEEIAEFIGSPNTSKILSKYAISKKEIEKKRKSNSKVKEVDFQLLIDNINIHSRTAKFYEKLESLIWKELSEVEKRRLILISNKIKQNTDIDKGLLEFESSLLKRLRVISPHTFEQLNVDEDESLRKSFEFISERYNESIRKSENLKSSFATISDLASINKIKHSAVFLSIGENLAEGKTPSISQIRKASYYVKTLKRQI